MRLSDFEGRATVTVEEAAQILGISRTTAYQCASEYRDTDGASGLPVIQLGRRLLVPLPRLTAILSGQSLIEQ